MSARRGVLVTELGCEEHAVLAARPGGGFLLVERETLTTIDHEGRSRGRVSLPPHLAPVAATAAPSGRWLGIVGHERGLVVDLAEGRVGAPFPVVYGVRALAFARDEGSVVVQGVAQQGLRVPSGERSWGATGPNENVWALATGPSRIFALHDTDIAVYDAAGALSARVPAPPPTRKAVLAALSDDMVRLGAYGAWTVLDVASGRTLCETKVAAGVRGSGCHRNATSVGVCRRRSARPAMRTENGRCLQGPPASWYRIRSRQCARGARSTFSPSVKRAIPACSACWSSTR
ncbi:MAG TPA: hypothetical protein VM694_15695 [Polyangium sp.]|nr:hypothetical protein [Polyangium sp.]